MDNSRGERASSVRLVDEYYCNGGEYRKKENNKYRTNNKNTLLSHMFDFSESLQFCMKSQTNATPEAFFFRPFSYAELGRGKRGWSLWGNAEDPLNHGVLRVINPWVNWYSRDEGSGVKMFPPLSRQRLDQNWPYISIEMATEWIISSFSLLPSTSFSSPYFFFLLMRAAKCI